MAVDDMSRRDLRGWRFLDFARRVFALASGMEAASVGQGGERGYLAAEALDFLALRGVRHRHGAQESYRVGVAWVPV